MEHEFIINKKADWNLFAKKVLFDFPTYKLFTINGNLGAGKTTFIQALCNELGVKQKVLSPTYSIVHEYESANGIIYHMDLYRIKHENELTELGFEEYLDKENYCFIEWPAIAKNYLHKPVLNFFIELLENEIRKVNLQQYERGKENQITL